MDAEAIRELFREFGTIEVRRMFGGQGLFVDSLMIGLVSDGVIHLKADTETIPSFEREGCRPFRYATKNGQHTLTSYWTMPEFLYDDAGDLAIWARTAHGVALRAAQHKKKPVNKASRHAPKTKAVVGNRSAKRAARKVRRPSPKTPKSSPRGRSRT